MYLKESILENLRRNEFLQHFANIQYFSQST